MSSNPYENDARGSWGLTDRRNCCNEESDGSRTSPTAGDNVGKRRARLSHTVGPKTHATHSSSLINDDDRRGTILLVSSILMIRDESFTTPHYTTIMSERRGSASVEHLKSLHTVFYGASPVTLRGGCGIKGEGLDILS